MLESPDQSREYERGYGDCGEWFVRKLKKGVQQLYEVQRNVRGQSKQLSLDLGAAIGLVASVIREHEERDLPF